MAALRFVAGTRRKARSCAAVRLKSPRLSGSGCGTPCRRTHLAYASEATYGFELGARTRACFATVDVLVHAARLAVASNASQTNRFPGVTGTTSTPQLIDWFHAHQIPGTFPSRSVRGLQAHA